MKKSAMKLRPLARAMVKVGEEDALATLLDEILTPCEASDLAKRWRLLELLRSGESQRSICLKLQVSLCKVTRGSRILKQKDSMVAKLLPDAKKQTSSPKVSDWKGKQKNGTHLSRKS